MLGAPATGKTSLAKKLAEHYSLHHLSAQDVIQQILADDPEFAMGINEGRDSSGRISDEGMASIFKKKMHGWMCQNQGFVLDGFPKNDAQAKLLFSPGEHFFNINSLIISFRW